ncbi:hypothetical protein [Bacillus mycoides]|uniref:hypothetical protein n=1 Tax=Bacillus mycoides TaxID=1405 RepID=UPI00086458CE|nr:hypothetical protein [Bacillus mycoides]OHX31495.1 hypothetical protein BWGOE5_25750 [Bacillus mycoides]SCM87048.1 Uncharacterized protein BWAI21_02477 [Bacillus mycoides]
MEKHTTLGNVLLWIGPILVFLGLCMTNVITDIPFFEGKHKTLGIIILFIGVLCLVVAHYFKIRKNSAD